MDPKELKAEVDAYMQDYDKKMAEVRPGWGGNPAKQFSWGRGKEEKFLSAPAIVERAEGPSVWQRIFTPTCW